jgi:CubicO group peptidase (beta-lactamase class C family)
MDATRDRCWPSRAAGGSPTSRTAGSDGEAGLPVEPDTIWRIYSMTKPITSVAAMLLYEEGALSLFDPVAKFIPSFEDLHVYRHGMAAAPVTARAAEPMLVWHLLTHTSGLTYGFQQANPVDEAYRAAGFILDPPPEHDLASACDVWAGLPLLVGPGAEWNYSVSTDVLGRVVEVVSGQSLDEFFAERIFEPLGMPVLRAPVAVLQVDRDRQARRPIERAGVLDDLVEGRGAVGRAQREGEARARARERPEPHARQDLRRAGVPRVGDDEVGPTPSRRGRPTFDRAARRKVLRNAREVRRSSAAKPAGSRSLAPSSDGRDRRPGPARSLARSRGRSYHRYSVPLDAAVSAARRR